MLKIKMGWKSQDRIRRFWKWVHNSRWPFVMKQTLAEQERLSSSAIVETARMGKEAVERLRDEMGPLLDKLITARTGSPWQHVYIEQDLKTKYTTDFEPYLLATQKRVDTHHKYRIQFDIADDLVRWGLVHGNDDYVIKEMAERAKYHLIRELKTINFMRLK
jgi:N-acetylmuramoyl-L-alanine amidase CwlA